MTIATRESEQATRSSATANVLVLLAALAEFESVGVTQIARHLSMPTANAYRLLRDLRRQGFVEQSSDSKRYRLTLRLFELGCAAANRTTVRDVAAIEMERLARQLGIAVNLGVLVGREVLYLEKIQTDDTLILNLPPGTRAPAHCTAMGKAMLAFESRSLAELVGEGPYASRTANSITTFEALQRELSDVRRRGYAVDREELTLGIWCVSAPIMSPRHDVLGALSVTAYRPAIDEDELARLGPLVVMTARRIAARTGNLAINNFR
jgi:IclR family KDG regulon transcriptional repressor